MAQQFEQEVVPLVGVSDGREHQHRTVAEVAICPPGAVQAVNGQRSILLHDRFLPIFRLVDRYALRRGLRHAVASLRAAVDGSPASREAVGFAFDYSARHGLALRALHAWEVPVFDAPGVTVPPSLALEEIAAALPTSGLAITPEEFLTLARTPRTDYDFLADAPSVEGFLFPDSYIFLRNTSVTDFVDSLIRNFGLNLTSDLRLGFEQQGLTVREAVIVASPLRRAPPLDSREALSDSATAGPTPATLPPSTIAATPITRSMTTTTPSPI